MYIYIYMFILFGFSRVYVCMYIYIYPACPQTGPASVLRPGRQCNQSADWS